MKNINYIQASILILVASVMMGCATNSGGTNPLGTIDKSLSAVEGAAQSGRQVMNAGATAVNAAGASQVGLVDTLVRQLGVSQQQAMGGAGAIFQVAQGNMNPQAFSTLSQSIPGMNNMLGAAPAMPAAPGLTGGLTSMMGNANNTLGSAAALAASFQQLNLSPDMVGQFIPVITNYVRQTSGRVTADLLQSALGVR